MRYLLRSVLVVVFLASTLSAKVVVFSEQNFPSVDTQPVSTHTLSAALGTDVAFAGLDALRGEDTLRGADLLVLPYGSAVPVEAWPAIERYLHSGGNLLIIGGEPLHVPVAKNGGSFVKASPQDAYSRALGFQHVYTVPVKGDVNFSWREGYSFLPRLAVQAQRYFAVEGRLNGLGYVESSDGTKVAAPVIVSDHPGGDAMPGSRVVALDFDPKPGYWDSADGISLIRAAANYARNGATKFWIEAQYSTLRTGEAPDLTLHLQRPGAELKTAGVQGVASKATKAEQIPQDYAMVELLSGAQRIDSARIALSGPRMDAAIPFRKILPAGFYTVRATWFSGGKAREFYANGFQVEDTFALPLELNDQLDAVAAVYAYALKAAGVEPVYTTTTTNPGFLICPSVLPHATLYVLTSETNETAISFRDKRSGRTFSGQLDPGRAALLLVGEDGTLITSYGWNSPKSLESLK